MNNFLKLCFCLILLVFSFNTILAQVTDALTITPEGNVNVANGNVNVEKGKVQEKGNDLLPKGAIIMWYGGTTAPAGWAICDGTQGTPNLSGRFVVAAGNNGETTYKSGDSSGVDKQTLTVAQLPVHNHNVSLPTSSTGSHNHGIITVNYSTKEERGGISHAVLNMGYDYNGSSKNMGTENTEYDGYHNHGVSGDTQTTGGNASFDNRPRYYALCYIMKL
jgi:microcystin-dependent protein